MRIGLSPILAGTASMRVVVGYRDGAFSTYDPRHRHIEAAREFARDAKAHRAAELGAFDGGERQRDVAPPAVVGEVLLAHQSALAQLPELCAVEQDMAALQAICHATGGA